MRKIAKALKKSKSVAIFVHISPDPDCMGSMQALALMLGQKGIVADVYVDTDKSHTDFPVFNFNETFNQDIDITKYDTLITVDVASSRLLGKYGDIFTSFENTVSIDHHGSRDLISKTLYCESTSASCSEVIFKLAKYLKVTITPKIANYLFAGIVGDTACFQHDNVNQKLTI